METNLFLRSNFFAIRHVLSELEDARHRSYPEPRRDAAVREHTDCGGRPGGLHGAGRDQNHEGWMKTERKLM